MLHIIIHSMQSCTIQHITVLNTDIFFLILQVVLLRCWR